MDDPRTNFLAPETGFFVGIGSAMNIAGNYYQFNKSPTPVEADLRALRSDWLMIGRDIAGAMDKVAAEPECLAVK